MTSDPERAELLRIARVAILERVTARPTEPFEPRGALLRPAAVFVTIHRAGALRGCIGHLQANLALARVVAKCAAASASEDPRFPPVTLGEADSLEIEISILGPLEPVQTLEEIVIGRDGLLMEHGRRRGLLLPQVASEWNWDANAFVAHTCQKAGLPRDAWPSGGAKLFRFEAEVFAEKSA